MAPDPTSVLVVLIPEADSVVGEIRRLNDPSARDGMPAHVTVLTPFVPLPTWDEAGATRLERALTGLRSFRARFRTLGRFEPSTLFLVPEPQTTFARLAACVADAFPEWPPYGGAFSSVHPHLTLAHGISASALAVLESELVGTIDVTSDVRDLVLYSRSAEGRWKMGPRIPLPTG